MNLSYTQHVYFTKQHVVTATSNAITATAYPHQSIVTERMIVRMVLTNEIALTVWSLLKILKFNLPSSLFSGGGDCTPHWLIIACFLIVIDLIWHALWIVLSTLTRSHRIYLRLGLRRLFINVSVVIKTKWSFWSLFFCSRL